MCARALLHFLPLKTNWGKNVPAGMIKNSACRRMLTKRGAEERFVDGRRGISWKRTGWRAEMRMQGKLIRRGRGILIMSPDVSKWSFDKFPSPSATLPPSFHAWTCRFAKALSSLCTFAKSMSKLCVGFCGVCVCVCLFSCYILCVCMCVLLAWDCAHIFDMTYSGQISGVFCRKC